MDDGGGSCYGDKSYETVENVSESQQSDETEPENCKNRKELEYGAQDHLSGPESQRKPGQE